MDKVRAAPDWALLASWEALGLDADLILARAGITRAVIDDRDGRLDLKRAAALWAAAVELSSDEDLALHAAEALPFGAYKVLDFLAAHAPTVGAALLSVSRYFPLVNTAIELPVAVGPEIVHYGMRSRDDSAVLARQHAEYVFATIFLRVRRASHTQFCLRQVEFSHAPPPSIREHQRVFGCPVSFGAGGCRMTITRDTWDTPVSSAVPDLFQVLEEHAAVLLAGVPVAPGVTAELWQAIANEMRGGDPSLEHVARKLAMSTRTLQRRLSQLGESYVDLVDRVRQAAATAYLCDPELALGEVAYLLGFAEQSSFSRAFKRWTGQTPREFRRNRSG